MLQVVIQVIENQALVWLGAMYAPLLPAFGLIANVIAFYFKLMLAVWLHSPPITRYSASRTSNLAYGLMLRKPLHSLSYLHPLVLAWLIRKVHTWAIAGASYGPSCLVPPPNPSTLPALALA